MSAVCKPGQQPLSPEVYASDIGNDSSILWAPVKRYPTRLGAFRAVNRSEFAWEARQDGWVYTYDGTKIVQLHSHGEGDGSYGEDGDMTCGWQAEVHQFSVASLQ